MKIIKLFLLVDSEKIHAVQLLELQGCQEKGTAGTAKQNHGDQIGNAVKVQGGLHSQARTVKKLKQIGEERGNNGQ